MICSRRLHQVFDERQLVELTSAIAWENYRARFDHAFGIESEGFYKGALCLLPARRIPPPLAILSVFSIT